MIDGNDLPQEAWHKSSYSGGTGLTDSGPLG